MHVPIILAPAWEGKLERPFGDERSLGSGLLPQIHPALPRLLLVGVPVAFHLVHVNGVPFVLLNGVRHSNNLTMLRKACQGLSGENYAQKRNYGEFIVRIREILGKEDEAQKAHYSGKKNAIRSKIRCSRPSKAGTSSLLAARPPAQCMTNA